MIISCEIKVIQVCDRNTHIQTNLESRVIYSTWLLPQELLHSTNALVDRL